MLYFDESGYTGPDLVNSKQPYFSLASIRITDEEIAARIGELFDLRPAKIIEKFHLKNPIYEPTAAYGHVGRHPYQDVVEVVRNGKRSQEVALFFGWELLDSIDAVKKAFNL